MASGADAVGEPVEVELLLCESALGIRALLTGTEVALLGAALLATAGAELAGAAAPKLARRTAQMTALVNLIEAIADLDVGAEVSAEEDGPTTGLFYTPHRPPKCPDLWTQRLGS